MSVHTVERILWEFGDKPSRAKEFVKDPDAYLAKFPLTEKEFAMLRTMDVKALDDYKVSTLLSMMVWPLIKGSNPLMVFEYLKRMNYGDMPNNFQLPGWQFALIKGALFVRNLWVGLLRIFGVKENLT